MKRILLAFVTALIALPVFCAAAPRVLSLHEVHRIGQPPQIDGNLGDECWDKLPENTDFYEFGTKMPRPAAVRTAWRAGFDGKGLDVFTVRSPYLGGANEVEVLLPDDFDPEQRYLTLYVLPVNAGLGGTWGDCLKEVKKTGLHNEHDLICVTMAFDTAPWYGAHATDPSIRHEAYIKEVVVPLVEKHYPVEKTTEGRLLLGFSKSGWGSFSLLLRNPGFFGYACSWDAPLTMDGDDYGIWGTEKHWGTKENFLRYRPTKWAETNGDEFRGEKRLALLGHQFFGNRWACPKDKPHTVTFHERLEKLDIPHVFDNSIQAPHSWNRKWLVPAIRKLMEIAK